MKIFNVKKVFQGWSKAREVTAKGGIYAKMVLQNTPYYLLYFIQLFCCLYKIEESSFIYPQNNHYILPLAVGCSLHAYPLTMYKI